MGNLSGNLDNITGHERTDVLFEEANFEKVCIRSQIN